MEKLPLKGVSDQASRRSYSKSGQALLIILLTMSVALTVVLSVASRSVVDISTTTYEEEALRAFNAAEAGVEQALLTEESVSDPDLGFEVIVDTPAQKDSFQYPQPLSSMETATFWFVSHRLDTNDLTCKGSTPCLKASEIEVCWGLDGNPDDVRDLTPAMELSIYYAGSGISEWQPPKKNFAGIEVKRYRFDPHHAIGLGCGGPPWGNNFTCTDRRDCTIGNQTYEFSALVDLNSVSGEWGCDPTSKRGCLIMAKVKMFYSDDRSQPFAIKVAGGTNLPAQGIEIDSTGMAGESVRKVKVIRGYAEPLSILDSTLYSKGQLVK